ncbi:unnamed protein product [Miscanthus lutarioriparius]|uniref:Uncharacterized protein n=1 Tax=Miscanthus lutarioriparius TaxID=422564 RepID=A0A811QW03_9POAL|nr:unnamed protein product [Miscanthus lutarioriparius]
MQIQIVHQEPELAVDRCLGVQRWDFDPMLVEVEAGLMSQAMSEVALAVDLCLSGSDECGLGQTSPSPSLLESEQAGGSLPPVQVDFPSSREDADEGGSAMPAVDGGVPHATATMSIQESLEERLYLPLHTPLIHGPPRLRKPRTSAPITSLRRSDRIATKPREADSTKQAQCVLMQKLGIVAPSSNVDSETVRK